MRGDSPRRTRSFTEEGRGWSVAWPRLGEAMCSLVFPRVLTDHPVYLSSIRVTRHEAPGNPDGECDCKENDGSGVVKDAQPRGSVQDATTKAEARCEERCAHGTDRSSDEHYHPKSRWYRAWESSHREAKREDDRERVEEDSPGHQKSATEHVHPAGRPGAQAALRPSRVDLQAALRTRLIRQVLDVVAAAGAEDLAVSAFLLAAIADRDAVSRQLVSQPAEHGG